MIAVVRTAPLPLEQLWRAWSWEPVTIVGAVLGGAVYAAGVRRLWRSAGSGRGIARWRAWCFGAGLGALLLALVSPLDAMGEMLFAAHMVQHLVLILAAAPLLVLGSPLIASLWALPRSGRRRMGRWWARSRVVRPVVRIVGNPIVAWVAQVAALWFWHLPVPYQAALANDGVHALEHASFLGTALLFWWVVLQPAGRRRLSYGAGIVYVAAAGVQSGALGAILTFAGTPWYPAQSGATALSWGLTPLQDQQLAGLIMWIPAGLVYVGAAIWMFVEWLRSDEARPGTGSEPARVIIFPTVRPPHE